MRKNICTNFCEMGPIGMTGFDKRTYGVFHIILLYKGIIKIYTDRTKSTTTRHF